MGNFGIAKLNDVRKKEGFREMDKILVQHTYIEKNINSIVENGYDSRGMCSYRKRDFDLSLVYVFIYDWLIR